MDKRNQLAKLQERALNLRSREGSAASQLSAATGRSITPAATTSNTGMVYLLIDTSGSMAGDKIVQARNGASEFAQSAFKQGFAVGVIPFHHTAYHACRPTSELQELAPVLRELQAGGGTDVNAALTLAGSYLAGLTAGRRILYLITDGMTENAQEALQTGSRLKAAGIEIMTLGTPDADHAFLKKLASQERLTAKVSNHQLEAGIASMAKLLPAPSSKSSK